MGLQRRHHPLARPTLAAPSPSVGPAAGTSQHSFLTTEDSDQGLSGTLGASEAAYGSGTGTSDGAWGDDDLSDVLPADVLAQASHLPQDLEAAVVAAQSLPPPTSKLGVDASVFPMHYDGALLAAAEIEDVLEELRDVTAIQGVDSQAFFDAEARLFHAVNVGDVSLQIVQAISQLLNQDELRLVAAIVETIAGGLHARMAEFASLASSGAALLEGLSTRFLEHQAIYEQYRDRTLGTAASTLLLGTPAWLQAGASTVRLVRVCVMASLTQFERDNPIDSLRAARGFSTAVLAEVATGLKQENPLGTLLRGLGPATAAVEMLVSQSTSAAHVALMNEDVKQMQAVREEFGPAMTFVEAAGDDFTTWITQLQRLSGLSEAFEQQLSATRRLLDQAPGPDFYAF